MATITKENLGTLHEKVSVKLEKKDYLPAFEKSLKEYSKKANIPGFRKGMVPAGLIKKMYGNSLFTDEILKSVDKELISFLQTDQQEIFAQPLPMDTDLRQLDVNNPNDYVFDFEIGLKPALELPDLAGLPITEYKVSVSDDMINEEIKRIQNQYGKAEDQTEITSEENMLHILFNEVDENAGAVEGGATKENTLQLNQFKQEFRKELMGKTINDFEIVQLDNAFDEKELEFILKDLGLDTNDPAAKQKHFKIQITHISQLQPRELNEELYTQLFPDQDVITEADFRNKIKEGIGMSWQGQTRNQIHDQLYHQLIDTVHVDFPEPFLKKWMKMQGQNPADGSEAVEKTDEEIEKEFPGFLKQLKWTLIADKLVKDGGIDVKPDEVRNFAKQQLFSYMGGMGGAMDDQPWMTDYLDKMMKDRKYVEDAYTRLQTQKTFEWAETKLSPTAKEISADDFKKMVEDHHHH